MNIEKYISRSTFVFNYEKIENIPAKIYSNSNYEKLIERFEEPVTNPAIEQNDELPETLAILKAKSKGGYSQFSVSPVKTVLKSFYDDEYSTKPELCITNFNEKVDLLAALLDEAVSKAGVNFKFGGLTFLIEIKSDDLGGYQNSIDYMCQNFFHINVAGANLTDSDFRFSVEKDGFFINYTFGHIITFDDNDNNNGTMNLCAEIDINDKYDYNNCEDKSKYCFNTEKIHKMMSLLGEAIKSIDNIIQKREVDFNEFKIWKTSNYY